MAAVAGIFGFMMRSSEKGASEKSKSGNQGSSAMAAVSFSWQACILTDIPLQYAFPFFRRPPPICSLSLRPCRGFEYRFYVSIKSINCNFVEGYGVNMVQKIRHYQIISNEHVLWMCDCKNCESEIAYSQVMVVWVHKTK